MTVCLLSILLSANRLKNSIMLALVIPWRVLKSIIYHVEKEYPKECGGLLFCHKEFDVLYCESVEHLTNLSDDPTRLFIAEILESDNFGREIVFYHSHTSKSSPKGLTKVDKTRILYPYAMIVYAPEGRVIDLCIFEKTPFGWKEFPIYSDNLINGCLTRDQIENIKKANIAYSSK